MAFEQPFGVSLFQLKLGLFELGLCSSLALVRDRVLPNDRLALIEGPACPRPCRKNRLRDSFVGVRRGNSRHQLGCVKGRRSKRI